MQTIPNKETLYALLQQGATIITPNNRLSNQWLSDYLIHHNTTSIVKPRCLPYPAWLRTLYQRLVHNQTNVSHPLLLTSIQQRHLWRNVITETETSCNEGLLTQVQDAWRRCQNWQINYQHPAFARTPQTQRFQQWQYRLQHHLNQLGAITEEQLVEYILSHETGLFKEQPVVWACFDEATPAQQALQQRIAEEAQQYNYDLPLQMTNAHQYGAKDTEDEYQKLIQWIKKKQEANESRIAVVIPDLQSQPARVQRLLQRNLPADQFNLSLGHALINHPLVAHALTWLSLEHNSVPNHDVRLLLHSPYLLHSQSECLARGELLQQNNLKQEPSLSISTLVKILQKKAPTLAECLATLPPYPKEASPKEWMLCFKERLLHMGFPGAYSLSSASYQHLQRFMTLFDDLLSLSLISPIMNQKEALDALNDLAGTTIFQLKTKNTPIQVLGLLEASGGDFDSLWVCGLTDQCLPQKPHLSAFIPIELQRTLNMPHAVPEREWRFAEQTLTRLQNGSKDSVFSYPGLTGDIPNLPSPLIADLPHLQDINQTGSVNTVALITHEDHYILPLQVSEPVSGGTSLLADQAKCPFRAFATHRLHAKAEPALTDGPSLSERGKIMHRTLELLWKTLNNQQRLLALTVNEQRQHIEQAILMAMAPFYHEERYFFAPLLKEIELARLHRLIHQSLEWEKKRAPFVVEAVEQDFTLSLAGIPFRVRVDRLDSTATDSKWVIDYKSSLPNPKPWHEERPEEPQLLLYALLDNQINTLLFLELKAGRITCAGLSEENITVTGLRSLDPADNWEDYRQQWRNRLSELAKEFRDGYAHPQPQRKNTCQQCHLPALCRVSPS